MTMLTKNSKGKSIAYHAYASPHDLYVGYDLSLSEALKAAARRVKELEEKGEYSFLVNVQSPSYPDLPEYCVNVFAEDLEG